MQKEANKWKNTKEKYLRIFLDIHLVTNELIYEGHCLLNLA